jgi:three-Cys-motif partner protein
MAKDFHNKPFDDETILKLEIFRGYVREWLPVFLSRKSYNAINIFDFFAGPGRDCNGVAGSPLIIIDELKKYLENTVFSAASKIKIRVLFNDSDQNKMSLLQKEITGESTFIIETTNLSFDESFTAQRSVLESTLEAKLVILDQSGIKQISHSTFRELINFPASDFIFFISSSILKRFISEEGVRQYFPDMSTEEVNIITATDIHRFVCSYYKKLIPVEKEFYLTSFSIKKRSNIYGIIFGSGRLLGLEKFLKVCWNKDSISGEANYDIDDDIVRQGKTLYPELNISKKLDLFKDRIMGFLQDYKSNNELYQYTLENGCLPKHTNDILKELQKDRRLEAKPSDTRKRSFYINWENYRKQKIVAKFRIKK